MLPPLPLLLPLLHETGEGEVVVRWVEVGVLVRRFEVADSEPNHALFALAPTQNFLAAL